MAFHTFGPGLALDKITTRGLSTVTAKVEDADTGEPLQAYTMDDPATPTQLTTNRYGYFPEFRAPDTARRIRLTFGNLALDQIAHEAIEAAADAMDQLDRFIFPGLPATIILEGEEPIIDASGATLTFPAEASIIAGNTAYTVAAGTVVNYAPAPTTIAICIMFNRDTQTFQRVLATNISQTAYRNSVVVATVTRPAAGGGVSRVWMPCPFTQSGIPTQNRIDEMLRSKNVPNTRQVPTFASGQISNVEHIDRNTSAIIRRDTYTFTATQIKEERVHVPTNRKLTYTTTLATLITEES